MSGTPEVEKSPRDEERETAMLARGEKIRAAWIETALVARLAAWRWPISVAALTLITMLVRWPYLDVPISADEGGYATAAYWWARGDTLYRHITITRPQGIFVVFRVIDALGLGSTRGIHLFAAGYTALTALVLLAIGARLWGRVVGWCAALLFAVLMATPYVEGFSANAELFMLLPLLGSLYLLLLAGERSPASRGDLAWLSGSGFLAAVALLVKPSGVAALALAALWLARRWRLTGSTWRAWLGEEAALGLGFVAGLAPALIHGLLTAPEIYLNAVLFYRLGRDSIVTGAAGWNFVTNTLYVVGHLAPVFLLALIGVVASVRATAQRDLLALWLLTSLAGMALGGDWFLHYYVQLLPPLAMVAVLGARALLRVPNRLALAVLQGSVGTTVLVWLLAVAPLWSRPAIPTRLPEYEPGITTAGLVAAYLRAHVSPDERIYVAYDHADIYYFSQRRPAARWLHFRELTSMPGGFTEQLALLSDPATAPRYIVGAQGFTRWGLDPDGRLRALVARDYVLETTIEGVPVYRRVR